MFNRNKILRFLLESWNLSPEQKAEADKILAMDSNSPEYKEAFRKFSKKYHPDKGDKSDTMAYFNGKKAEQKESQKNQTPPPSQSTSNTNNGFYAPSSKAAEATKNNINKKNKHIGAKIAVGAAAAAAATAAGKAIYDKSKYKKWLKSNGKTSSDVSFKEWKSMNKSAKLNESFDNLYDTYFMNERCYQAIYESFNDIDTYDLQEIKYYAEMYEELDREYFEAYYDEINDMYC